MMIIPANIDKNWHLLFDEAQKKPYWAELQRFLLSEYAGEKKIFPPKDLVFNAFLQTPLGKIKIVILGQDPYHGPGQAMGLAFSVPQGVRHPPSLRNIFKEIQRDFGYATAKDGDLSPWARQGVFLLNTVLTVEESKAASHQNKGWEDLTDDVIRTINAQTTNTVFLLWGAHAQKKKSLIDVDKHLVLESVHPSPLSAHRGFIGCGHFTKSNEFLKTRGKEEIDWRLP